MQGIGQVGGEVWRPYAQHSAKRRGEVRWETKMAASLVQCSLFYSVNHKLSE